MAEEELKYYHCQEFSETKNPLSWCKIASLGKRIFDHMFDHLQNRTTREQEYTRARKSIFFVSKSAKKTQNNPKNVNTAIGVVEAASSSLVI